MDGPSMLASASAAIEAVVNVCETSSPSSDSGLRRRPLVDGLGSDGRETIGLIGSRRGTDAAGEGGPEAAGESMKRIVDGRVDDELEKVRDLPVEGTPSSDSGSPPGGDPGGVSVRSALRLEDELGRSFLRRPLVADLRDDGRFEWMKIAGGFGVLPPACDELPDARCDGGGDCDSALRCQLPSLSLSSSSSAQSVSLTPSAAARR